MLHFDLIFNFFSFFKANGQFAHFREFGLDFKNKKANPNTARQVYDPRDLIIQNDKRILSAHLFGADHELDKKNKNTN